MGDHCLVMGKYLDPYEVLANAIIMQAVDDYREAKRFLNRHPELSNPVKLARMDKERRSKLLAEKRNSEGTIREVERFFRSGWFDVLSKADGVELLSKIQRESA